ncbi:MAG TPA: helix-turn-helix transcriptional regulator [Lachnospiraceae bacterium]
MNNFAQIFKQLRIDNQISQADLALALKISRSAISMYERGEREPDIHTLGIIADYFQVDMDTLMGRKSLKQKNPLPNTEVDYKTLQTLIARNGHSLSTEEKQNLIKTLLS